MSKNNQTLKKNRNRIKKIWKALESFGKVWEEEMRLEENRKAIVKGKGG